jgi:small subunit ribosomal protein S18
VTTDDQAQDRSEGGRDADGGEERGYRPRPPRDRDRDRGDRGDRDRDRGPRRPRGCEFCRNKTEIVDYKDTNLLKRYVAERGRIEPRRKVGTCAKHQRVVSQAIKRARHVALLPYTAEHVRLSGINMGRR